MAVIGIFDSGCGGLSVCREVVRRLPGERYVYFADNAHCPYGEKSRQYITERALEVVRGLLRQHTDLVVVACNTATSAAIATLRATWPEVPFVGIEPPLGPAVAKTRTGVVGVLATEATLKGERYQTLRDRFSQGSVHIVERPGKGFVELVEAGKLEGPEVEAVVEASVRPLLEAHADVLVLGCTHYPFLQPVISRLAGPDVAVVDPAPAVARQVEQVLRQRASPAGNDATRGGILLQASGDIAPLQRMCKMALPSFRVLPDSFIAP